MDAGLSRLSLCVPADNSVPVRLSQAGAVCLSLASLTHWHRLGPNPTRLAVRHNCPPYLLDAGFEPATGCGLSLPSCGFVGSWPTLTGRNQRCEPQDSNLHSPGLEPSASTTWATFAEIGAPGRNRTADPLLTKQSLCRLSYLGNGPPPRDCTSHSTCIRRAGATSPPLWEHGPLRKLLGRALPPRWLRLQLS